MFVKCLIKVVNNIGGMGCTSTVMIESRKVVPLPPEIINSYIDKFPAIVVVKLKEKFDGLADRQSRELSLAGFLQLYSRTGVAEELQRRLFVYFTDSQDGGIKFRQFVVKYATIVKCDPPVFCHILFELYKDALDRDLMTHLEFQSFLKSETARLERVPPAPAFPLSLQKFTEWVREAGLRVEEYQSSLLITTEEDIPFKLIGQQLASCDFNDFVAGGDYYLLSNAWFYRWSFYYQDVDQTQEMQQVKSTKVLPADSLAKRYNRRRDSNANERKLNDSLRSSELGNTLVEQPRFIDFDEIEGEYRGELKESLKISAQVKVISQNLWRLLSSLHPAEQAFKRRAINTDTIEYYPKAVYYVQASEKGEFLPATQDIKLLPSSESLFSLKGSMPTAGVFTKNFGEKEWREVETDQSLAEVSLEPRFFIVVTADREKFIEKTRREEVSRENLQLGDRVFANFALGNNCEAVVIGVREKEWVRVHFKGHSYRYELQVGREEVWVVEEAGATPKRKNEGIIKGIANVGNTCFMNSIVQCLVATPVLEDFLLDYAFSEKKEPIGFGLSSMARALLRNERPAPHQFKKMIDLHLPLFSGYDQHDAQEFLNVLLDKLNDEIAQKPTVVDYLFGGKITSHLSCNSCSALKNIEEKMYILSLPIPEPEFNYFSIVVVPVTSRSLRKLIFRLPRTAIVADYCAAFEERSGMSRKDVLFVETSFGSLKKVKTELLAPQLQQKPITEVGIVPSVSLLAFEKLPFEFYLDLLAAKREGVFRDFQPKPQAAWTICKVIERQSDHPDPDQLALEYISPEGDLDTALLDRTAFADRSARLGTQSELSYKKIILRRYNASLRRIESFGLELLAGVPRWASYNDLLAIVERYLDNLRVKDGRVEGRPDYVIRFLDPGRAKCIFCQRESQVLGVEEKEMAACCEVGERDVPIGWIAKNWVEAGRCNVAFCSAVEVDAASKAVESARQEVQVGLETCMQLHSRPQVVEMECDRCHEKHQSLEHLIGSMPNILVVHMKEFRYTSEGHLVKLDLRLKWQEFLDSARYSSSPGKLYELYALVRHSGNSHSGHYTCMAKRRHPFENRKVWVLFDDDSATIVQQQEKFIDDAYLLFYKKVDMPTSSLVIYSDLLR